MKKIKITLLVFYVILIVVFIYESALPQGLSRKQNAFFKKVFNNISSIFIKNKYIKAENIIIGTDIEQTYYVGDTLTLNAKVEPNNASYKTIFYSSSDSNILKINQKGEIEFISSGIATVTLLQEESNIYKSIIFVIEEKTVEPDVYPTSLDIKTYNDEYSIPAGEVTYFYTIQTPSNVTLKKCTFSVSDESKAKMYGQYFFALAPGEVVVTCKHDYADFEVSKTITITDGTVVEPTTYKIEGKTEYTYLTDTTMQFEANINDEASNIYKNCFYYAWDPILKYKSKIIDLDPVTGKAEILNYGVVDVSIFSFDMTYIDTIRVFIRNVLPEYKLPNKQIVLGNSYKIEVNPINGDVATYFNYEYESSDEQIAVVDELGNITPKKTGKVLIKVKVDDGLDKFEDIFTLEIINNDIENSVNFNFGKFIRKGIAHFLGFITFGFISYFLFILYVDEYYKKFNLAFVVILVNGLVFACLTEVIQLFAPGRDGTIKDVILDYSGYLIACILSLIIYLIYKLIRKKKGIEDRKTPSLEEE